VIHLLLREGPIGKKAIFCRQNHFEEGTDEFLPLDMHAMATANPLFFPSTWTLVIFCNPCEITLIELEGHGI
jgi:hypothetical protein